MNVNDILISKGWEHYHGSGYCMKANGYRRWIHTKIAEKYVRDNYPKEYAEMSMNCKQAGELMISKGWEYDPFRDTYCRGAMCVPVKRVEEYVRNSYPEEYAEMSMKNDVASLSSRVSTLEQKDIYGEPCKGSTYREIHYKLEAEIKSLQAKCRGLDGDLKCARESAARYRANSKCELEHELAEEKQMAWSSKYGDSQTQNALLRRSVEDLEGQLSRKQEAKDKIVAMATKDIREFRDRVLSLEGQIYKADECVVKQGYKIKDRNATIDRLKADQCFDRRTIKDLTSCIKRRNAKISRAKELFKLVLSFASLTIGLRDRIKEELQ